MFGSNKFNSVLKHPGYNDPTTIGLVLSGFGTVMQLSQQSEARKDQKAAQAAAARVDEAKMHRERVKAARDARIQNAIVQNYAGNQGTGGSSGVTGASSSAASQYGSNVGFLNEVSDFTQQASAANQSAANHLGQASMWQAIGGVGNKVFEAKGGWSSIFGGNTIPSVYASKDSDTYDAAKYYG